MQSGFTTPKGDERARKSGQRMTADSGTESDNEGKPYQDDPDGAVSVVFGR